MINPPSWIQIGRAVGGWSVLLLAGLAGIPTTQAAGLEVGQIVQTNFSMANRYLWTNHTGQIFTPYNTTVHLGDFDGRILFMEFFAVW